MPIYTYRCDTCGVQFDKRQSFSDKPLTRCPECNGSVRRLLQTPGIVFKGSGWYITDSRRSSSASVPAKSKDSTSSDTSSSTSSSESRSPSPKEE
ncbi:MAG: FmdB family transcriptional regulator [Thermoflexales bacterium]|nr:FmdB family transcriptional regulator [Thermoflexales bacterium]